MANYIDYIHSLKEVISTTRPHRFWLVELALNAVFLSPWRFWDRVFKVFLSSTGLSGGTRYVAQTGFEPVMILLVLFLVLGSQAYIVPPGCVASFLRDFQNTHHISWMILHPNRNKKRCRVFHIITHAFPFSQPHKWVCTCHSLGFCTSLMATVFSIS